MEKISNYKKIAEESGGFFMKRVLIVFFIIVLAVITATATVNDEMSIALLVNGNLGDKSFFDSAAGGMKMMEERLGAEIKIIEMNYNPGEWEPTLDDISSSGIYDLIIVGTWPMVDILTRIAPYYPDVKYIIFDARVNFTAGDPDNIYAINYKQNEGSFMAGALAGLVTKKADLRYTNPGVDKIGVLGGTNTPITNDFIVGYIEGARYVNSEATVFVSYAGAWDDPVKGKELSRVMYSNGADVVFNVAAKTGNGIFSAAKEMDRYSIGVDSDAQLLYSKSNPAIVEHILSSMLKDVGLSLYLSVEKYQRGELDFGQNESLGLKENVVGLAMNRYFTAFLKENPVIKKELEAIREKIIAGKIEITTAFGKSNEEIDQIIDNARP